MSERGAEQKFKISALVWQLGALFSTKKQKPLDESHDN
jgi:hypothetical protein